MATTDFFTVFKVVFFIYLFTTSVDAGGSGGGFLAIHSVSIKWKQTNLSIYVILEILECNGKIIGNLFNGNCGLFYSF